MTIDSITQTLISLAKALLSPASFKNGDFKIEGPVIIVLPAIIALLAVSIWSFIWLYMDAKKRGKSGILAVLFVIVTGWPLSFVWWFWLRPQTADAKIRTDSSSEPLRAVTADALSASRASAAPALRGH